MAQTKITDANLASSGTMPAWDGSNMTNMGDGITKSANDPTTVSYTHLTLPTKA